MPFPTIRYKTVLNQSTSNDPNKNKQLELHVENRNKILFELQHSYNRYSYCHSSELGDNFTSNLSKTDRRLFSSVVENLLIEMNRKQLKKIVDNNNTDCCRCKQFLNIPQNLIGACENISDYTEEYVADLNFVQSKNFVLCNQESDIEGNDQKNFINPLSNKQESDTNFDDDSVYTSSIDLLCNIQRNKRHRQETYNQQINPENAISTQKKINPSVFASFQSLEGYFNIQANTQQNIVVNNYIVPDSDKEYSSSSDMFRDSLERQDTSNSVGNEVSELLEESDLTNKKSVECSLIVQNNDALKNAYLEAENDLVVPSDDNNFSNITLLNENCSLYKQNRSQLRIQLTSDSSRQTLTQAWDWNFYDNCPVISSSQIKDVESPQKDSAYDTYQLSVERIPTYTNCNREKEDVSTFYSQKLKNITPYQRNESTNDTRDLEFLTIDITKESSIFDQNQQLCLSPFYQENNRSMNSNSEKSCTYSRNSQRCKNLIEDIEYEKRGSKEKKLKSVHESIVSKIYEKEEKISSQWLGFMLDTLNIDAVTFQSVKMIFSVLQHEQIATQYMRKRCWKGTLEQQAVNAILDFCDISEIRNKTNIYTQEIVQIAIGTLDKIIGTTELNKKYRVIFCGKRNEQSEEEIIPPVVDLWKKQLNFEGVIIEDNMQTRERRWLIILDDFAVIATENFIQFAKKSRILVKLLTCN
ncbi:PREDICTED: uncharacterized protein LOC108549708 [Eufriesea mexicana]|uniref:uncharacterized protein LOC108549708 n=1 Tax=Eufriesea mexicana TaxID=516756 RepID=UPI00083C1520|nr:PREDICTED: uncharacterized protein LOC108549708 [Eufriesea mexicana]